MRTVPRIRRGIRLASTAAALALLPAASFAQQPIAPVVVATTAKPDILRAEQLEQDGELQARTPKTWREAAGLYRRAAELRGNSVEAVALHRRSAWLYSAVGDNDKGRQQLERSARISLDRGDVVRAANTLFDAALMAASAHDVRNTDATLQRLGMLLDAPLMPDDVRAELKGRLTEPARVARR